METSACEDAVVAREAEVAAQMEEMIARDRSMIARAKAIEEREQSVKMREQALAKQEKALSQIARPKPQPQPQQEMTTASTNDSKQPGITALSASTMNVRRRGAAAPSGSDIPSVAERKSATLATSKVSRSTDRFSPSTAQAANVTAMSQRTQAPRKDLFPKTAVQKSNTDEPHRLGTFIGNVALLQGKPSLSMQTACRYANSVRKFYASSKMPTGLTDRMRAWAAQKLNN